MIGELKTIVLDARDIAGLSAFYTRLAGWTQRYADEEWITITTDDGWRIGLQAAPDHVPPRWPDPAFPQQVHLDVTVDDIEVAERAALPLGATRLPGQGDDWRVYADPAGKPFCLLWSA
ncbi:VOC family protein [Dactylosporangium roseum]|uniref:VOC family protein n=1 Tax=Dactylosporangium roseum TaxID=47989 RepID=A0ABY5ZE82_9ACTN|nr:VOC family protein [Dactylosporangium roseum]UWZ39072.1 VOC family protein [Dactylosporangium roseum]